MAKAKPFQLWDLEIQALSPPESLPVAEWANKNIILLPESSRDPGPFQWQRASYTRDIMNLYQHTKVRHLVLKWSTQSGKTLVLFNILGYLIDQDPFTTLLMYPSDNEAKSTSRTRIQPMIDACKVLRSKKPANLKRFQLDEMHFPGMVLHIVGGNSPTPLSQKPCRNVFRDEINKLNYIKSYGDPMELSFERLKSFFDIRKIVDVSSPTEENGNITKQEASCQVIIRYYVPCPFCHRLQTLDWPQIKFENQHDLDRVNRIQLAKVSAYYECRYCEKHIADFHKEWMLDPKNGAGWFDVTIQEPKPCDDPIKKLFGQFEEKGLELTEIASRVSSLYSPWLRWADIVGKFLEAHLSTFKRFDKLRTFINDWLGEEWIDKIEDKSESDILKLKCDFPPLVVPKEILALTCGIDCQKDGFYFVVRAWARDSTSCLIRYGHLLTWDDVYKLLFDDSYEIEGSSGRAGIWRAAIDTGGGKDGERSMTESAYNFIARCGKGVFGIKGSSREMIGKMKLTIIGHAPGRRDIPLPGGGLRLWIIDTDYFKDIFHSRMQIKAGDSGVVYLHSETDMDYAKQIIAEEKRRNKDGRYKWVHFRGQNHYLDAEVYAACIVDPVCYGGLRVIRDKSTEQEQQKPKVVQSKWMNQ